MTDVVQVIAGPQVLLISAFWHPHIVTTTFFLRFSENKRYELAPKEYIH